MYYKIIIMTSIVSGVDFDVSKDYVYTKAKVNANGRKQIGILNKSTKKSLFLNTPLMLTWGVNEYTDDKSGQCTYDLALQFPLDEFNNDDCVAFLKNMQALEQKLKEDAIENSKDWLNKNKLTSESVDVLWSPMLKYPKDKDSGEPDYSRPPTLKVKIPFWDNDFKGIELYDENQEQLYPNDNNTKPIDFITKGSNIATIIQCGGIWVANGKFGVTWRLFQAVVKPRESLRGKCHITLSSKDKEKLISKAEESDVEDDEEDVNNKMKETTTVEDSDDEEDVKEDVKQEVTKEITKAVVTEDVKPKKRVVKKKVAGAP